MNVSRESVAVAFEDLLKTLLAPGGNPTTAQPFVTVSRKFVQNPNQSLQPALYIMEHDEDEDQKTMQALPKYVLRRLLFLYCWNAVDDPTPQSTQLNNLVDAVDHAILGPIPGEKQQLAAFNPFEPGLMLVEHVWISGRIGIYEGVNQNQALARIPVSISTGA